MKKAVKYTTIGIVSGVILFLIICGLSQISAQKKAGKAKTLKDYFDNLDYDELRKEAIKGIFVGGGIALSVFGFKALYEYFIKNIAINKALPFFSEKFLRNKLLEIKQIGRETEEENFHYNKINKICQEEFNRELSRPPILHGSRAKKVFLPTKSDYDIALIFNKNQPIEKWYELTYNKLKPILEKCGYSVRDQRFSTGVSFEDMNGTTFKIDILPSKETSNYNINRDLVIWNSVKMTHQKTNIDGHNHQFTGSFEARDTARLIKHIKDKNDIKLSSSIINKLVPAIIRKKGGHSKLGNLILALSSIAEKFNNIQIRDPFNSNNNYLEKYTNREKIQTQNFLYNMLDDLKETPRNLEKYF